MKKLILSLGVFAISISAFPCGGSWNYCSTVESSEPFEDEAIENCCAGTSVMLNDLCGDEDKLIIVTSNGPSSSCLGG